MDESLVERAEIVALLFNVSDIVALLVRIERILEDGNGQEDGEG